ncbi:hypothetical protein NDU88_001163 [Pleurodeles waltl]|uniref:Uncharacterized protein n=1 Tax=Pleurodeles waltl TaxID=8319 RepID=A0AAV7U6A7_PLEWA|nr:hypothetical protein NDU88_001163 [Pleurodeles waltl]
MRSHRPGALLTASVRGSQAAGRPVLHSGGSRLSEASEGSSRPPNATGRGYRMHPAPAAPIPGKGRGCFFTRGQEERDVHVQPIALHDNSELEGERWWEAVGRRTRREPGDLPSPIHVCRVYQELFTNNREELNSGVILLYKFGDELTDTHFRNPVCHRDLYM